MPTEYPPAEASTSPMRASSVEKMTKPAITGARAVEAGRYSGTAASSETSVPVRATWSTGTSHQGKRDPIPHGRASLHGSQMTRQP
jgi:hypothetical protein